MRKIEWRVFHETLECRCLFFSSAIPDENLRPVLRVASRWHGPRRVATVAREIEIWARTDLLAALLLLSLRHRDLYKTGISVASNLNRPVTLNRKTQHFLIQISFVWLLSNNNNNNKMRILSLFCVLSVVLATFCDAAPNRSSTREEPIEEESLEKMTPHEQKVHLYRKMRERLVFFKFPINVITLGIFWSL